MSNPTVVRTDGCAAKTLVVKGLNPLVLVFLFAASARAQTADTTKLFADARAAEITAEEAIRKFAEFKPEGPTSLQECDEHIGNWCVYYEPAGKSLPDEPAKVAKARRDAIVVLQRALAAAPGRTETVFPLAGSGR